jgi:hypothetical protein
MNYSRWQVRQGNGVPQSICSSESSQPSISHMGLVSRATSVHTALCNCTTRDGGGPFEFGNQVLISSHRELLRPKVVVVSAGTHVSQRETSNALRFGDGHHLRSTGLW